MRSCTVLLLLCALGCGGDVEGFVPDEPDAGSAPTTNTDAVGSPVVDARSSSSPDAGAQIHYDAPPQLVGTFTLAMRINVLPAAVLFQGTRLESGKLRLDAINRTTGQLAPAAWEIDPANPMQVPGMLIPAEASPTGSSFEVRDVLLSGFVCGALSGNVVSPIALKALGTWGTAPLGSAQESCP